jgi:8-amino-7-oxononanoate synthase
MFKDLYQECLNKLHDTTRYRELPGNQTQCVSSLNFSSNDYLGLSKNPGLIEAATTAGQCFGAGATGSRLLSGNTEIVQQFEQRIAKDKHTQAALIFNSGFQANSSVLCSLLDKKTLRSTALVFFDRLNHASLYQAVFLSKAELIRYRHNDMEDLSRCLNQYQADPRPKFIVTETVFGMDGDTLQINQIAKLSRKHNTFLYLDEAHATGILGPKGYGLSTGIDLSDIPHVIMGTFSKALGVSGGYIACEHSIKEYLINCCFGFIYSTAISPLVIGAAYAAWELIPNYSLERAKIAQYGHYFRQKIQWQGFNIGNSNTHIVPIILDSEAAAIEAAKKLLKKGFIVSCVRPPSVPPKSSRLRIAFNATHQDQDVEALVTAMSKL